MIGVKYSYTARKALGKKWPILPDAETNAKIAILNAEMDAIHHANRLYWQQGQDHTKTAMAEYQLRLDRLEKIRAELAELREQP